MLSSFIWVVATILVCAAAYYGLAHLPSRSPRRQPRTHRLPWPPPAPQGLRATQPLVRPQRRRKETGRPAPPERQPGRQRNAAPLKQPSPPPASEPDPVGDLASEEVWVTAVADGKTVFSERCSRGPARSSAPRHGARITLGNAGGVDITFNGKKLEPLGPRVRCAQWCSHPRALR